MATTPTNTAISCGRSTLRRMMVSGKPTCWVDFACLLVAFTVYVLHLLLVQAPSTT